MDDGIEVDGQLEKKERIRYAIAFSLVEATLGQLTRQNLQKMADITKERLGWDNR